MLEKIFQSVFQIHFASSHNKKKEFKNKKPPEWPENRTVYKSDNQGVKEENSSRPVGGAETGSWGGEDTWPGGYWRTRWARQRLVNQSVPCSHADKPGVTTGECHRPCNPEFQCGKNKSSKPLAIKICGGCGSGQPHRSPLERPTGS